jgi:hypothetical protein
MRDRTAVAILAAPILAAGLLLPGRAEANVSVGVACQGPTARVVLDGFVPGREISGSLLVALDGETVHVGSHRFRGPTSILTFHLPRGRGEIVAAFAVGTERWSSARSVACDRSAPALPPAPPLPPEDIVVPAPSPPVATPPPTARPKIDCAYLRRVGAGRRWLVRFGCVRPQPRITCPSGARWVSKPRISRPVVRVNGRWWIAGCQPEVTRTSGPIPVTG